VPLVTSLLKYGPALYGFQATVSPEGMFTNDDLFAKLGLSVPQTFPQLLNLCAKAKADGTAAVIIAGGAPVTVGYVTTALAVATVYGKDRQFAGELKTGKASFDASPGWHQALQEFIAMNNAGCFLPGVAGTTLTAATTEFAQGQGLVLFDPSGFKGLIDTANPRFHLSFHPFPGAAVPSQISTFLDLGGALAVNARSSTQAQAAAQTYIDFVGRPKQSALIAQIGGGLTQYQLLKGQIPPFMSATAAMFRQKAYVVNPFKTFWNPNVALALEQNGIGLITGQTSVDDVLNAMDAAWKQGPA
jgi:raffinose/stachyose/melibiose transport system substrate-binding protein